MAPDNFRSDIGPDLPPRQAVYRQAHEVQVLAALAAELATAGPKCDLPRAVAQLDRIRAILGTSEGEGDG